ncbi:MAG: N-acetyltransferase [Dehalococcoidia bacterium]|nr:MAG: N-acetyltransferase [Dehalococcoidia bacterium]
MALLDPVHNLVGEKVALGPLRRDLVPLYARWMNDFEVTRNLGAWVGPLPIEREEAWYDAAVRDSNEAHFTIYERTSGSPIGTSGLTGIDYQHRRATFGIVIGEKECWGKGYGAETARLVAGYGFTGLGLHTIELSVYSFNERAIRAYRRAGFRENGRRREAFWVAGRPYDIIRMEILSTDLPIGELGRVVLGVD